MFPNSRKPAATPLVLCMLGSAVPLQREAHQQLGAAQTRPVQGRLIEGVREIVGLGDEVTGTGRGHTPSVSLLLFGATPYREDAPVGTRTVVPIPRSKVAASLTSARTRGAWSGA